MNEVFTIKTVSAGQRLDIFCVSKIPQYSRAILQKAIKSGEITVNEEIVKPRYIIRENDVVTVNITEKDSVSDEIPQEPLKIPIIYEDKHMLAINKPAGITVHPGVGKETQTVASWFADRYPDSAHVGEEGRPGIVHRLDKDTSGVMILAKTQEALEHLKSQFKKHRARKEYLALVFGIPGESKGRITRPLARSRRNPMRRTVDPEGKEAVTEWIKEDAFNGYALIRAFPLTGRTHQIRVHLHFLGFPIVGDALYTFKRKKSPSGVTRQLLHAENLTVVTPSDKRRTFTAPLPEEFSSVIERLKKTPGSSQA